MNKVILHGRLSKEIEYREGQEDKRTARTSIAISRRGEGADFINIVAFGKTADNLNKYFFKGKEILIEGRINTGSYTNKDGKKVYTTDVIADQIEFCGSKGDSEAPAKADDGFVDVDAAVDSELPFM